MGLRLGIGNWRLDLVFGLWIKIVIVIWDWGLGFGIWDWDWDWGLGLGIGIGDCDWELGLGIWDLGLGLDSIGLLTIYFDAKAEIHSIYDTLRYSFLRFLNGCVVAGLMKN